MKVLLVYPNVRHESLVPPSLALLSRLLKNAGITVDIFDSTDYEIDLAMVDPDRLTRMGWDQHAEILSRAVARARTMYEVPIGYNGRTYAEGKKIRAYHALAVARTVVVERIARFLAPPEKFS